MANLFDDRSGYDYDFVETPSDSLLCKICQYPSREPHLSGCCGHTFCKFCLEAAKKSTPGACPMCCNEEFSTMANKQDDRTIRSLLVFCTNKDKGCKWLGEVNDIVNHLKMSNGCPYEDIICPNNCGAPLQRQGLSSHVKKCPCRKVDCQYCHIIGEHQFIEGEHKELCPKFPIACPNKCEVGSFPRDDVEEHMKICLIQCEYHMVGCEERMPRKDQKKHNKEKMEEHLSLTISQLRNIGGKLVTSKDKAMEELTEGIAQVKDDITTCTQRQDTTAMDLTNTQKETRKLTQQYDHTENRLGVLESQQRALQKSLCHWQIIFLTLLSASVVLLAVFIHFESEALIKLETEFQGKIIEIETTRITELEAKLEMNAKHIDQIFWNAEINSNASKLSSGDQIVPVIVKMSEYAKKKSDEDTWYSHSFYTHHKGYKMCLNIEAASKDIDNDTHLSVWLYLMKGSHDDQLEWPLKGHCGVKLLNQIGNNKHYVGIGEYFTNGNERITSGEKILWYSTHFITYEDLHKVTPSRQYIKDDSIFFEVDFKLE